MATTAAAATTVAALLARHGLVTVFAGSGQAV